MAAELQQFIKNAVAQDKVVVFSKSYCPYCTLAKDVFSKVKQPIKVYELDEREDGAAIQDTLYQITGFRTQHAQASHGCNVDEYYTQPVLLANMQLSIEQTSEQVGYLMVPQVFINGNCVGGGSDVDKLYKAGKLEPMLIG